MVSNIHDETETIVNRLYLTYLEREADKEALDFWIDRIAKNKNAIEDLRVSLVNSHEYKTLQEKIFEFTKLKQYVKKPIFIFGVPRSGTTLLYNILSTHPKLVFFSGDEYSFDSTQSMRDIDYKSFFRKSEPIEGNYFWRRFFYNDYQDDISIGLKIEMMKELKFILEKSSDLRFLSKTPEHSTRLNAIQKIFPDAKFINVCRDPRAVIYSIMKRHENDNNFLDGLPIKDKTIYLNFNGVEKWTWMIKEFLESTRDFISENENKVLTVFYEDLIKNPLQIVEEVFDFCELELLKFIGETIPSLDRIKDEKWKGNFTKEEDKKILETVSPILKQMNYPYKQNIVDNIRKKYPKKNYFNINFHEEKIYSQNGEDGILRFIFSTIGTTNKFFVELAVGDGILSNARYLLEKNWKGIRIIRDTSSNEVIKRESITCENLENIFAKYRVPKEFDLLSINIELNDFWIWEAMTEYYPNVVVIAYNASIPPNESRVVKYDPTAKWDGTNYFGASLLALTKLAKSKGYELVGCDNSGSNAFFIKNEIVAEKNIRIKDVASYYRFPRYGLVENGIPVGHPKSNISMIEF